MAEKDRKEFETRVVIPSGFAVVEMLGVRPLRRQPRMKPGDWGIEDGVADACLEGRAREANGRNRRE